MLAAFIIAFNYYMTNNAIERANESLTQSVAHIKTQLDAIVENMDRLSLELSFSEEVRAFSRENPDAPIVNQLRSTAAAKRAINTAYARSKPIVLQVNIIRTNGQFIGAGNAPYVNQIPEDTFWSTPWIQTTLERGGLAYLTYPRTDEWSKSGLLVFSLARMIVGSNHIVQGDYSSIAVSEVQQDYASVEAAVQAAQGDNPMGIRTMIFDENGTLVYPYGGSEVSGDVWSYMATGQVHNAVEAVVGGESVMLCSQPCDNSEWVIAQIVSRRDFLSPVREFQASMIFAGAFVLFIALCLAYLLSRPLTIPIKRMVDEVRSLTINTLPEQFHKSGTSHLPEIEELRKTFYQMLERLQNSISDTIKVRSLEMQARMMALQSRMNPHFLYNTISSIHVMADQDGSGRIMEICEDLTSMLRYVLREYSSFAQLREETEFAFTFLRIMSKRYLHLMEYEIHIPESMMEIAVPKIIIQPLVENCFKHGLGNTSPWRISVVGSIDNGTWRISVSDNGDGFSDVVRDKLLLELSDVSHLSEAAQNVGFEHIGLKNIYGRLYLAYGDKTIFEIAKNEWGGAIITIGGVLDV